MALLIHDPVYRIRSPGTLLNSGIPVDTWDEKLEKLGGRNSAYWPNYSVKLPKEVSIYNYYKNYHTIIIYNLSI